MRFKKRTSTKPAIIHPMRASDLEYLSHIPSILPDKLGDLLKKSTHHRVYEYGENEIIKVPRRRFNFLYSKRSHLEADLDIVERYFPGLAVHTVIHSSRKDIQDQAPRHPSSSEFIH